MKKETPTIREKKLFKAWKELHINDHWTSEQIKSEEKPLKVITGHFRIMTKDTKLYKEHPELFKRGAIHGLPLDSSDQLINKNNG